MKVVHMLAALAAVPLAACAGNDRPSPEVDPGAPPPARERTALDRLLGSNPDANAGPCPLMGVLYDSARLVEFSGPEERFSNVAFTAEMRGVRGLCRYTGADPIEMSLEIDMAFGKGPAAQGATRVYRYWVAVTRANLAPIEKQYFEVPITFPRGADRMAGPQIIERIVIPRANDTVSGANFEILVGFDLTPQQLEYNRAGKRFRVDVGAGNPNQQPPQ
ncbi:MAG: hypothetical protein NW200_06085 [Hyphomonadaceae bacterium]|nr:hypothetical protein [Hyphomonadaceae bacterium]